MLFSVKTIAFAETGAAALQLRLQRFFSQRVTFCLRRTTPYAGANSTQRLPLFHALH